MASKLSKLFFPSAQKLNGDSRNKLLVLNLGGLLVQNIRSRKEIPGILPHDISRFRCGKRIVFKRPFYEEFLEFCFQRFDVGIWSSLQSQNLEVVLENIMGESKSKLKFAWNQGHCTIPGSKWKDRKRRHFFLKDLNKLGGEQSSNFSLSNTLLIDNEPYKALLNPQNTAIFPDPYTVSKDKDTFLDDVSPINHEPLDHRWFKVHCTQGPEGEMRAFLEGLVNAEDVPSYVEENRIGQPPLTPSHPDWGHYSDMLKSLQRKREADGRKSAMSQPRMSIRSLDSLLLRG